MEWCRQGKLKYMDEKLFHCYFFLPKIAHGLAWNWTLVFTMRDRGLNPPPPPSHGMVLCVIVLALSSYCVSIPGVYKLSINLLHNTRRRHFGWHEVSFKLRTPSFGATCEPVVWRFLLGACELINIVICNGATVNIMLKMYGASA